MDNLRTKRCYQHDYHEPCIYLVTVTVIDHQPLLGQVTGDSTAASIRLTALGEAVRQEILRLPLCYPQLQLLQYQVMPDHVHLVIRILERLPEKLPLGNIIAAWKHACGKAFSELRSQERSQERRRERSLKAATPNENRSLKAATPNENRSLKAATPNENRSLKAATPDEGAVPDRGEAPLFGGEAFRPHENGKVYSSGGEAFKPRGSEPSPLAPAYKALFSPGFNDSILRGKGQLTHMIDYVKDNPRRLLVKHTHPEFFHIHRDSHIGGFRFDAVGNLALLERPMIAVHCRSRWTPSQKAAFAEYCLSMAAKGVVLIGAFISTAEKAIAFQASKQGFPLIHLVENGFDSLYKPVGQEFYSCAEGRLLLLAPWPYHSDVRTITRQQCVELNTMAETIASRRQ